MLCLSKAAKMHYADCQGIFAALCARNFLSLLYQVEPGLCRLTKLCFGVPQAYNNALDDIMGSQSL